MRFTSRVAEQLKDLRKEGKIRKVLKIDCMLLSCQARASESGQMTERLLMNQVAVGSFSAAAS